MKLIVLTKIINNYQSNHNNRLFINYYLIQIKLPAVAIWCAAFTFYYRKFWFVIFLLPVGK